MTGGRIVVGVDGSPASLDALGWALGQARLTGDTVEAVWVWPSPYIYGGFPLAASENWEADAKAALDTVLTNFPGGATDDVVRRVARGYPVSVLLECAKQADLLVVGSRGRGGFAGMLLGSVSQHLAEHAACPVVIVRHSAHRTGSDGERESGSDAPVSVR